MSLQREITVVSGWLEVTAGLVLQVAVNRDEGSLASNGDAMGVKSALLSRLLHAAAASQVLSPSSGAADIP